MLQRLPIVLTQVKVNNIFENLLNQTIYLFDKKKKKLLKKYTTRW